MEQCENIAFHLAQMQKMNISKNIKIKIVTDVSLSVDSTNMKVYTCR